jgi:hypothetical protein
MQTILYSILSKQRYHLLLKQRYHVIIELLLQNHDNVIMLSH